jgi:hypothetical protein
MYPFASRLHKARVGLSRKLPATVTADRSERAREFGIIAG